MNEINRIKQIAQKESKAHPRLANDILESARLVLGEIADGESAHHELELFENHVQELKEGS